MSKIRKIQLTNFRAYKDQEFPINPEKNIILLYGNNGFGKTSFFDGIEWGFTGKIERYDESAKEKNEYPLLKNSLSSSAQDGLVTIELDDNLVITRKVKKVGQTDYNAGMLNMDLSVLQNKMVYQQYLGKVNFVDSFNFSHLLSQELLSNFIRGTKDTDRYKAIVKLFGLSKYDKFNPHFKLMIEKAKQDFRSVEDNLVQICKEIEVENAKASIIDIDPLNKRNELGLFLTQFKYTYNNLNDHSELNKISAYFQQGRIKAENKISILNKDIYEVDYIIKNYNTSEKIIKSLNEKKNELKLVDESIRVLERFSILEYILQNIHVVYNLEENQSLYEQMNVKHTRLSDLILTNPLFTTNQFDMQIKCIVAIDNTYEPNITRYLDLKEQLNTLDALINIHETELSNKFGLEKKLLKAAYEFLVKNLQLESCPVCQNNFNASDTIKLLKDRLASEYSPLFKELIGIIDESKAKSSQLMDQVKKAENELEEIINKVKYSIIKEKDEIEAKINEIISKKKINDIVLAKLSVLNIPLDIEYIKDEYNKYLSTIKEKGLRNDLAYYIAYKKELEQIIRTEGENVKFYTSYKVKHKINSIEEAEILLKQNKDEYNLIDDIIAKFTRIIQATSEVLQYDKTIGIQNKINELKLRKSDLEKEKHALNSIICEYENLMQGVRKVIEEETKTALHAYIGSIRKFYTYLNPHLYLNNFDIRIDDSNPLNNRLILEVFSEGSRKVNPSYTFSSAQNNVLALSIFLSFALYQKWSNLDFVCMDDPIQNLDDINIFNFVDIVRSIVRQTNKQIYISTHDDRVYNFMMRKFRGAVQSFRFTEYGTVIEDKLF